MQYLCNVTFRGFVIMISFYTHSLIIMHLLSIYVFILFVTSFIIICIDSAKVVKLILCVFRSTLSEHY